VNLESIDDFEDELRQALERRAAPPSLKRKLLERRSALHAERRHFRIMLLQRLAASVALAAVLIGGFAWRHNEELRRAEAAREQVMTALRITAQALNQVNAELNGQNRADQDSGQE
jgi:hypothetical protein